MRASPAEYLSLKLRAHELLRGVPLYDVTVMDLPGGGAGAFLILYQFPGEVLSETRNATVHGWICLALAPIATGYRLSFAVYVLPISWVTRPYLIAIEPFRRFMLYPVMLHRIRRAWLAAYGASG